MEIMEEEAVIVRRICREFLAGKTPYDIAKRLTEEGIPIPMGKTRWRTSVIESILKNEKYKGDALLQNTVTTDFLTHTHKRSEGEAPQFYVEKNHPAIVRPEVFEMVQEEFRRRKAAGGRMQSASILSGRIVCEDCGGFYGRKVWHSTSEKTGLPKRQRHSLSSSVPQRLLGKPRQKPSEHLCLRCRNWMLSPILTKNSG